MTIKNKIKIKIGSEQATFLRSELLAEATKKRCFYDYSHPIGKKAKITDQLLFAFMVSFLNADQQYFEKIISDLLDSFNNLPITSRIKVIEIWKAHLMIYKKNYNTNIQGYKVISSFETLFNFLKKLQSEVSVVSTDCYAVGDIQRLSF